MARGEIIELNLLAIAAKLNLLIWHKREKYTSFEV